MGWLANAFTWWNGASWGTSIFTRRHGKEVGRDDSGNVYFQHRQDSRRRWVIYDGANDGSRVPPDWQAWLRGTIDDLTGTMAAFRPDGSLGGKGIRPAATGDYQPWIPE